MSRAGSQNPDRDAEIRRLRKAGETLSAIGGRYGLSRERVRQICERGEPVERPRGPRIGDDELLDALRDLARDLGRTPTRIDMEQRGPYSAGVYHNRWGSWSAACIAAGLEPNRSGRPYTDDEMIVHLLRVGCRVGWPPSQDDVRAADGPSPTTYQNRWGSWSAALEAAMPEDGPQSVSIAVKSAPSA